jgi:hypothetical protein
VWSNLISINSEKPQIEINGPHYTDWECRIFIYNDVLWPRLEYDNAHVDEAGMCGRLPSGGTTARRDG